VLASLLLSLLISPAALTVNDLDGRAWTPLNPAAGEASLVIFVSSECPISSRYAPEIDRIAAEYGARHVRTFIVYAEPGADAAKIRTNFKEFHAGSQAHAIIDQRFALTADVGATVTPEAAIYTSAGRKYRGRIDDLNIAVGQSRRVAEHRDLRDALDAVLAGRAVAQPVTSAIGCVIERKLP
jgi:hypothetical protein